MAYEDMLTEDQLMMRAMARDFCQSEVASRAAETDAGRFPVGLSKKMASLGLLGMTASAEYGGGGADEVSVALVMEEISAVCPSLSVLFAVQNSLVCAPMSHYASDAQKNEFLRGLARGEKLGCFALSEPSAGSDAASLKTRARREGCGWRIDGEKRFISNSREADLCLIFAVADQGRSHKGINVFIAETRARGFEVGHSEEKMGLGGSSACDLRFDFLELPIDSLLGEEGQGFEIAMTTLDAGRIGVAAQGVGFARAGFEASVAYAREREAFGKPISRHQSVRWKVADMATGIDAARLLYLKAARMKDSGQPFSAEASMAKVFSSDMAQRAVSEAVQIHGGNGYMKEYAVEKFYRAAKATQIYEGTNEILRLVIAKHIMD